MASSGIYVDANLLVLLVAGLTERGLISKHRRLREYTVDDYDLLGRILDRACSVPPCDAQDGHGRRRTCSPNIDEPERSYLMTTLGKLIDGES